jgi:cytochrome c biogenesis protein CcmG/thiol:disulfide interchange protein DsbE
VSALSAIRRKPARMIAIAIGLVLIAFVAVLATRSTQSGTPAENPLVGQVAPPISGVNELTGHSVSLASERGHYVVVAFFASWCAPCATETPQLVAFLYSERAIHASVLGVIYQDSVGNAVNFLRFYGAKWPVVADAKGSIAAAYGVAGPPEAFVVAPTGRVVAWIPGGVTEPGLSRIVNLEGTGDE